MVLFVWYCWQNTLSSFDSAHQSISEMPTMRKWKKPFLPLLWLAGFKIVFSSCCVVHCAAALDRFPYPQSFDWLAALTLHEKQARLMRPLAEWEFGWRCVAGALALWEMCVAGWDSLWTQRLAQRLTTKCYRCNGSPVCNIDCQNRGPGGLYIRGAGCKQRREENKEFRRRTDTWSELRELMRKMTRGWGEKEKQRNKKGDKKWDKTHRSTETGYHWSAAEQHVTQMWQKKSTRGRSEKRWNTLTSLSLNYCHSFVSWCIC